MDWKDMLLVGVFVLLLGEGIFKLRKRRPWIPSKKPNGKGVTFQGDLNAVSRSFFSHVWRNEWRWLVFEVDPSAVQQGYYIYFVSEGKCKRYFWKLGTRFVALQLGPHPVTIFAFTRNGDDMVEVPLRRIAQVLSRARLVHFMDTHYRDECSWI